MSSTLRQIPITCSGHTRPVVDLRFSDVTPYSYFLISACKGTILSQLTNLNLIWHNYLLDFVCLLAFCQMGCRCCAKAIRATGSARSTVTKVSYFVVTLTFLYHAMFDLVCLFHWCEQVPFGEPRWTRRRHELPRPLPTSPRIFICNNIPSA